VPAWKKRKAMAEKPATFEQKIARLEAIVRELDNGNVELDKAVALFKEGKTLATECEELLKGAQDQINRAMEQPAQASPGDEDEVPF
jgi:exodeoxyribonuclease VII small subunit